METGGRRQETGDRTTVVKKIEKFEDLQVWKVGMQLAVKTYNSLKNCSDFGLRNQMQRAAVSVPSNIAEGYERNSNKEFIQHLFIAKGSCAELRTQIYIAIKIGILNELIGNGLLDLTKKISAINIYRMLNIHIFLVFNISNIIKPISK